MRAYTPTTIATTIPEDFGITRISGLTWDQWNAHLVAPKPTPDDDSLPGAAATSSAVAPLPNHSLLFSSAESSSCSPTAGARATTPRGDHHLHLLHTGGSGGDFDDSIYTPTKMIGGAASMGDGTSASGACSANGGGGQQGEFPCPDCGRLYKLKSSLRNHQKWECGKEPQFQCPFCAYRAKQKMHIGRHLERMHKDIVQLDLNKAPFLKELFMAGGELKKTSGSNDRKKKRRSAPWTSASSTPIKDDLPVLVADEASPTAKSDNGK